MLKTLTGAEIVNQDRVFVNKGQGVLLNGAYIGKSSKPGFHLIELEDGRTDSFQEDQIIPAAGEIRLDAGVIFICEEGGKRCVRGPFNPQEADTFLKLWSGRVFCAILARIDLAKTPIIAKEGQGLS